MAAAYLEAIDGKRLSLPRKKAVFRVLLDRADGPFKKDEYSKFPPLTPKEVKDIEKLLIS